MKREHLYCFLFPSHFTIVKHVKMLRSFGILHQIIPKPKHSFTFYTIHILPLKICTKFCFVQILLNQIRVLVVNQEESFWIILGKTVNVEVESEQIFPWSRPCIHHVVITREHPQILWVHSLHASPTKRARLRLQVPADVNQWKDSVKKSSFISFKKFLINCMCVYQLR